MNDNKMRVELLPHTQFLKKDGTFDKEEAIKYSAKLAGECYEATGWSKLKNEDDEKSLKRANFTLGLEHSTPYEHISIGFEITNVPKIVAMVLNNERQCSTSEKSARYTKIDPENDDNVSALEGELYYKWIEIFKDEIKKEYKDLFNDSKIEKLAQENARYLVSVFASTKMIHTVPWIQLNRIISFMKKHIEDENESDFNKKLNKSFKEFIECFEKLNIIDSRGLSNRKNRALSLFANKTIENHFGDTYSVSYKGSFAQLAQAHRHRTLEYSMKLLEKKEYFVPPILKTNDKLKQMWLEDINSVSYANPQGELILINESGTYEKFILKAKERLCTSAQQEIMIQTKCILDMYYKDLSNKNHVLANDMKKYTKGARCTFPDYECARSCKFKEGINLTRDI